MPNETDWGKHAAIAAWAGVVVAIVLVVVQEVWPPDPTHPMSLEVVSKPVVLSRWLAISILVGVTVAAIIITRRLIATRSDVAQHMDPQTRSQPTYPATQSQPTPVSRPISSKVSDDGKGFIASSADDFHVSILTHEDGGTKGLMAHILNERLTLIGNCSLTIFTAQRRISLMDEYEENLTFEPFSLNESAPIGPSCSSKGIWIVRKEVFSKDLFVGPYSNHPLTWPAEDLCMDHDWLLTISVQASTYQRTPKDAVIRLRPIEFKLLISWDSILNNFFVGRSSG